MAALAIAHKPFHGCTSPHEHCGRKTCSACILVPFISASASLLLVCQIVVHCICICVSALCISHLCMSCTASVSLHLCISHLAVLHCTCILHLSSLCLALHLSSLHLHLCDSSSCQPECLAPCLTWAVHGTAFSACVVWSRLGCCCILGMLLISCIAM